MPLLRLSLLLVGSLLLGSVALATPQGGPLPATATASSTGPAGGAGNAVDGSMQTRWESAHGIDPSWLTLDLGANFDLSRVVIHWEAANASVYNVQGSLDNTNWVTLSAQSGGTFGDRTDDLTIAGQYRYVRMFGIQRSPGNMWGYSIWEMEVYAVPLDADNDGFDSSVDCDDTNPNIYPGAPEICGNGIDDDCDGEIDDADVCVSGDLGLRYCVAAENSVSPTGAQIAASGSANIAANNLVLQAGPIPPNQWGLFIHGSTQTQVNLGEGFLCIGGGIKRLKPPIQANASGILTKNVDYFGPGAQTIVAGATRHFQCWYRDPAAGDLDGDLIAEGFNLTDAISITFFESAYTPLYDSNTTLEPELQEDTPTALITRLSDRARDRHAREDQFQIYDHYLSFYWEHRTAEIEIVDTIGKGGNTITFNVISEWPLNPVTAELRFFFRGLNTEAEYFDNGVMTPVPALDVPGEDRKHYTRSVSFNPKTGQPLQVGDRMEFELSQFLQAPPNGRDAYYGTAILYVVGEGVVPWEAQGAIQDSFPMPAAGLLGGDTTLPYQYSDEPDNHFMQLSTNLSNINGQVFVRGRRVFHTDVGDGSHDEAFDNPIFGELAGQLGKNYINRSCIDCHAKNGRGLPPNVGQSLENYVVRVGDAGGNPHATLGSVLQPQSTSGPAEGGVTLSGWTISNGLRSPNYSFTGATPSNFGARIASPIVGLGLLEAIPESAIEALADPGDSNGDGISGRMNIVSDAETGDPRLGRFGWKATQPSVRQQVAAALNGDMGVMTSVFPDPDCGPSQSGCDNTGAELADQHLDDLTAYVALLGVSARRELSNAQALSGETLFHSAGCADCHVDTFTTSPYHPHAELRNQTIHPYTDLLLHDMGPGLASTLVEGGAAVTEWRTAPLWNIGLTSGVSGGEAYLHDGRAQTLEEAILWHGGEGEASKQAYEAMSAADKAALIAFLQSL